MDKRWLWIILGSLVLGTVIVVVLIFALVGLPAAPSSSAAPPTPVRPSPSASATQAPTTPAAPEALTRAEARSEEHTSELQSLMRNSYAVFCLKKKKRKQIETQHN